MSGKIEQIQRNVEKIGIKNSGDALWATLCLIPFLDGQVDEEELEVVTTGLPKYLGQMRVVGQNPIIEELYRPFPTLNESDWPELFNFVSSQWDLPEADEDGNIMLYSVSLTEGTVPAALEELFERVQESWLAHEDIRGQIVEDNGGYRESESGRSFMPSAASEYNQNYIDSFIDNVLPFFKDNPDRRDLLLAASLWIIHSDGDHIGMEQAFLASIWNAFGLDIASLSKGGNPNWRDVLGFDRFQNFDIPTIFPTNYVDNQLDPDMITDSAIMDETDQPLGITNANLHQFSAEVQIANFVSKYTSDFSIEFDKIEKKQHDLIYSFQVLIAHFSPQYKSFAIKIVGEHSFKQLSQDWENLDKERTLHTNDNSLSSKNFDYETGLKDRDPLAVEIKRICDELGPDLMAKLVRAPIPVLALRLVIKFFSPTENDEDYVDDIPNFDDQQIVDEISETGSATIHCSGSLALLMSISEQEKLCESQELINEYLLVYSDCLRTILSTNFDIKEEFSKFLKTMRSSVRLAHKKHAVSLFVQKFQRDMKKSELPESPDGYDLVSFLENSLKDYKSKCNDKRSKLVFAVGLAAVEHTFEKLGFPVSDDLFSMWNEAKLYVNSHPEELESYENDQEDKEVQRRTNSYQNRYTSDTDYSETNGSIDSDKIATWLGYGIAILIIIGMAKCAMASM